MTRSGIKMIVFDLFGVIFSEGHLISNVLIRLLPENVPKAELRKAYHAYNLGEISERVFWQSIGQRDVSLIRQRFLDQFVTDPEFETVTSALKQHFQLAILSNLPADWADTLSHKFKFAEHFSPCLFSGHLQCKKPQSEIYRRLLVESGLQAQQIAFIDDRLENLQTAHEQGWTTVYYHRDQESHPYQPDFEISRLSQIELIWIPSEKPQEAVNT